MQLKSKYGPKHAMNESHDGGQSDNDSDNRTPERITKRQSRIPGMRDSLQYDSKPNRNLVSNSVVSKSMNDFNAIKPLKSVREGRQQTLKLSSLAEIRENKKRQQSMNRAHSSQGSMKQLMPRESDYQSQQASKGNVQDLVKNSVDNIDKLLKPSQVPANQFYNTNNSIHEIEGDSDSAEDAMLLNVGRVNYETNRSIKNTIESPKQSKNKMFKSNKARESGIQNFKDRKKPSGGLKRPSKMNSSSFTSEDDTRKNKLQLNKHAKSTPQRKGLTNKLRNSQPCGITSLKRKTRSDRNKDHMKSREKTKRDREPEMEDDDSDMMQDPGQVNMETISSDMNDEMVTMESPDLKMEDNYVNESDEMSPEELHTQPMVNNFGQNALSAQLQEKGIDILSKNELNRSHTKNQKSKDYYPDRKPLNFRALDIESQSKPKQQNAKKPKKSKKGTNPKQAQEIESASSLGLQKVKTKTPMVKYSRSQAAKAERNRKNHIAYITRRDPRRFRIIAFSQVVAANKITLGYREYVLRKQAKIQAIFDANCKRVEKQYATAVIRKYTRLYLIDQREKREWREYHTQMQLDNIIRIQQKIRARKSCPPKMDIPRFKELFLSYLLGWKVRRVMSYMKSLPEIREAIDIIKLSIDLQTDDGDEDPNSFSPGGNDFLHQVQKQVPEKRAIFWIKWNDLEENTVWIKKPTKKAAKARKSVKTNTRKSTAVAKKPSKPKTKNVQSVYAQNRLSKAQSSGSKNGQKSNSRLGQHKSKFKPEKETSPKQRNSMKVVRDINPDINSQINNNNPMDDDPPFKVAKQFPTNRNTIATPKSKFGRNSKLGNQKTKQVPKNNVERPAMAMMKKHRMLEEDNYETIVTKLGGIFSKYSNGDGRVEGRADMDQEFDSLISQLKREYFTIAHEKSQF